MGSTQENRPFLSSKISHFQNEANYKTFLVKMSLIRVTIKNHFHTNGFALSSPWNRGLGQHGNGLLKPIHCFQLKLKKRTNKAKQSKISRPLYSSLCGDNLDQYNLLLPTSVVTRTSHKGPNVGLGESICGCHFLDILHWFDHFTKLPGKSIFIAGVLFFTEM